MPLVLPGTLADQYRAGSTWQAADYGYLAMNFDPGTGGSNSTALSPAGTILVLRMPVRRSILVTNIVIRLTTAGSGLTSGQCFAALYQGGALKAQTATQHTAWQSSGLQTMALSAPQVVGPQSGVDVVVWYNGTTGPALLRGNSNAAIILNGVTPNMRSAKANTGITTTAPSNIGTETAFATLHWAALS